MSAMFWVWIAISCGALVFELASMSLTSIWFVGGALVALILSCFENIAWYWQVLAFITISLALMFLVRPIAKKIMKNGDETSTNVDSFIGKKVRMLTPATFDEHGTAQINDVVWIVKSEDGSQLNTGDIVEVIAVSGNKLIVRLCAPNKDTATKV